MNSSNTYLRVSAFILNLHTLPRFMLRWIMFLRWLKTTYSLFSITSSLWTPFKCRRGSHSHRAWRWKPFSCDRVAGGQWDRWRSAQFLSKSRLDFCNSPSAPYWEPFIGGVPYIPKRRRIWGLLRRASFRMVSARASAWPYRLYSTH